MLVMRRRVAAVLMSLALLLASSNAAADWMRIGGSCEYQRSWRDVTRGPRAIFNGAVYPVRSVFGALFFSATACVPKARCAPVFPLWIAGSAVWGIGRGLYWVATGAAEVVTLGQVPISPTEAVEVRLHPTVPLLTEGDPGDRCPSEARRMRAAQASRP